VISGPADDHLIRVCITDFAGSDMSVIEMPQATSTPWSKAPNASGRFAHHGIIHTVGDWRA
jgi:hypothetical protein